MLVLGDVEALQRAVARRAPPRPRSRARTARSLPGCRARHAARARPPPDRRRHRSCAGPCRHSPCAASSGSPAGRSCASPRIAARHRRPAHRARWRSPSLSMKSFSISRSCVIASTLRVRQHRLSLRQEGRGMRRHILEFVGDDVAGLGEIGERGPDPHRRRACARCTTSKAQDVGLRRIDMAIQPDAGGGLRQHARQLSAAENADGRAGQRAAVVLRVASFYVRSFGNACGLRLAMRGEPLWRAPCRRAPAPRPRAARH